MTTHTLPLLLLCGLSFLSLNCAKKGIDLHFEFKEGQQFKYHLLSEISTKTTTSETSTHNNIQLDLTLAQEVTKILEKGDAEIRYRYEKIGYLNTQNPEKADKILDQLKKANIFLTMSPYGELLGIKGLEELPTADVEDFNIFKILAKAHPMFPRSAVEVGRSWDRQQTFPIENAMIKGKMQVYKRFTVADTMFTDQGRIARINMEISMIFDLPKDERFAITQDENERLGIFGTGNIKFNIDRHEVVSTNAALFGKMIVTVQNPATGQPISTKLEVAQNIRINLIDQP